MKILCPRCGGSGRTVVRVPMPYSAGGDSVIEGPCLFCGGVGSVMAAVVVKCPWCNREMTVEVGKLEEE